MLTKTSIGGLKLNHQLVRLGVDPVIQFGLFSRCGLKVTFKFIFFLRKSYMWHLNRYFLTTCSNHCIKTILIWTYYVIYTFALFCNKNILTFSTKLKQTQGASSNFNLALSLLQVLHVFAGPNRGRQTSFYTFIKGQRDKGTKGQRDKRKKGEKGQRDIGKKE